MNAGEEFIKHISAGGAFNVQYSDVFTVKTSQGYQLQQRQVYRKPNR